MWDGGRGGRDTFTTNAAATDMTSREPRTHPRSQPAHGATDHRERICTLVAIAAENGSSISLSELLDLLPQDVFDSTEALRGFIAADRRLSEQLAAVGNEVTLRGQEALAEGRLAAADRFLSSLLRVSRGIELAGVSGSTAYSGAKPSDDIDFFLVTRERRLWITLLVGLTLARIDRLRSRDAPVYCFNRLIERPSCERTFRERRDALFAREALNLRVLRGEGLYGRLLDSAPWMADHFPGLYASRLSRIDRARDDLARVERKAGDVANAAAFLVLAPYLWLAGLVRNVGLRRAGRGRECFRTVVRPDFWATESILFEELRSEYEKVFA